MRHGFLRPILAVLLSGVAFGRFAAADEPKLEKLPADASFPILAWYGPPAAEATADRFREMAEAGFTLGDSPAGDVETMARMLDAARDGGVQVFVNCPELTKATEATVRRFKDHPALAGYDLGDEPGADAFASLAKLVRRIQAIDASPDHPCYLNLLPNYADAKALGPKGYAGYIDGYCAEVPTPMLSFDHYPVVGAGGAATLRPEYYENLEIASAAAQKSGKQLWAFVLATAHDPYPVPETSHLRLQAYSDLAYGTQTLQFFTYWTPPAKVWNFHEGPIGPDGKRTAVYDRVKRTNAEIQGLRGVFLGSRVISVGHTGDLPRGTQAYRPAAPVRELKTDGGGAVVSLLERDRRRFLVVVNRDLHDARPLAVTFDPATGVKRVAKDGTLHPLADGSFRTAMEPGDAAAFTWVSESPSPGP